MVGPPVCLYMYNKFCPSTIPCTLESFCLSVDSSRWKCDGERDGYICWNQRDRRTEIKIRVSGISEVTLPEEDTYFKLTSCHQQV